jgi:hypothetical protein
MPVLIALAIVGSIVALAFVFMVCSIIAAAPAD